MRYSLNFAMLIPLAALSLAGCATTRPVAVVAPCPPLPPLPAQFRQPSEVLKEMQNLNDLLAQYEKVRTGS